MNISTPSSKKMLLFLSLTGILFQGCSPNSGAQNKSPLESCSNLASEKTNSLKRTLEETTKQLESQKEKVELAKKKKEKTQKEYAVAKRIPTAEARYKEAKRAIKAAEKKYQKIYGVLYLEQKQRVKNESLKIAAEKEYKEAAPSQELVDAFQKAHYNYFEAQKKHYHESKGLHGVVAHYSYRLRELKKWHTEASGKRKKKLAKLIAKETVTMEEYKKRSQKATHDWGTATKKCVTVINSYKALKPQEKKKKKEIKRLKRAVKKLLKSVKYCGISGGLHCEYHYAYSLQQTAYNLILDNVKNSERKQLQKQIEQWKKIAAKALPKLQKSSKIHREAYTTYLSAKKLLKEGPRVASAEKKWAKAQKMYPDPQWGTGPFFKKARAATLEIQQARRKMKQEEEIYQNAKRSSSLESQLSQAKEELIKCQKELKQVKKAWKLANQKYQHYASKTKSLNVLQKALKRSTVKPKTVSLVKEATLYLKEALNLEKELDQSLVKASSTFNPMLYFDAEWDLYAKAKKAYDTAERQGTIGQEYKQLFFFLSF